MTSIRLVLDLQALWQVAASSSLRMSRTAAARAADALRLHPSAIPRGRSHKGKDPASVQALLTHPFSDRPGAELLCQVVSDSNTLLAHS